MTCDEACRTSTFKHGGDRGPNHGNAAIVFSNSRQIS
jgi:hypothetical protein